MVCKIVLLAAIPIILAKPPTVNIPIDIHNAPDHEKASKLSPNTPVVRAINRPKPSTVLRTASNSAPISAPRPIAPVNKPWVSGPPCSTFTANTGIKALSDIAVRLIVAKSNRIARMGRKW